MTTNRKKTPVRERLRQAQKIITDQHRALVVRDNIILALLEQEGGEITVSPEVSVMMQNGMIDYVHFKIVPVDDDLANGFKIEGVKING